jgi:MerR family transcriptional regulator, light-induced transcriptional regulator
MSNYSIRDLEQLSGIKAHTLRIWEQRFQLITPHRSQTNIRNYNAGHLKTILNIALLKEHGYKISKIANFTESQIQDEVLLLAGQHLNYSDQIHALTTAMLELDENHFEEVLNANVEKFGFEAVMTNIIYPFLSKIGILWITGAIGPVQEHFMSSLIRQKLVVAIDGLSKDLKAGYQTFVLYLPEGEFHEIGLLFAQYIIKSRNHKVIYLGQSLPQIDLEFVVNFHKPNYIFTAITSPPGGETVQQYLNKLSDKFVDKTILVTGHQMIDAELKLNNNVKKIAIIDNLLDILA